MARITIEKKISVSIVLSLILGALTWANTADKGIQRNAQSTQHVSDRQDKMEQRIDRERAEVRDELKTINSKLDRLIERQIP